MVAFAERIHAHRERGLRSEHTGDLRREVSGVGGEGRGERGGRGGEGGKREWGEGVGRGVGEKVRSTVGGGVKGDGRR